MSDKSRASTGDGPVLIRDPRSGVLIAINGDDGPPPERSQHDAIACGLVRVGRETVVARRVVTQLPIDRYRLRGDITEPQWRAGDRLRRDFEGAKLSARLTHAWGEEPTGGGWDDLLPHQLDARRRYLAAMRQVGPVLSPVLVHVACLGGTAADWAAAKGLVGKRAKVEGMVTLRLGLDALMLAYGQKTVNAAF